MKRRRAPVLVTSIAALVLSIGIVSRIHDVTPLAAQVAPPQQQQKTLEPEQVIEQIPAEPQNIASTSPFPNVRTRSLVIGLVIIIIGAIAMQYAKKL